VTSGIDLDLDDRLADAASWFGDAVVAVDRVTPISPLSYPDRPRCPRAYYGTGECLCNNCRPEKKPANRNAFGYTAREVWGDEHL
jgi:hypothetical protein